MEWVTTSTMLGRLRDFGDRSAWNAFGERFRPSLLAFTRRFDLPSAVAEDVVQEILLAFARAYREGQFDATRGSLRSWLFGIAYRQIVNRRRREYRELARRDPRGDDSGFWAEVPDEREAERAFEKDWEEALLAACLRQLRSEVQEKSYRVFVRLVHEGASADEVAGELAMKRDAVYAVKHRLLKRLSELAHQFEQLEDA